MDAFEQILRLFLEEKNYWTRHSVKVELTKQDKEELNLPTTPRAEIDLVAYNPNENEIILIEAKSFLNSTGVTIAGLNGTDKDTKNRYRLLNNDVFQKIVTERLIEDFTKRKIINKSTKVRFALAAGKVQKKSLKQVQGYLEEKNYIFFSPSEIKETIKGLADKGWDDNIVIVTAKLTK